jgi:acyl-CoA thioester hydrolase
VKVSVEVPYRDIDAMGHLNNVAYLAYLEFARQKYWLALQGSHDYRDIGFIVVRAEIDYRSQVEMGEILEIEIRIARTGNTSFDFQYRVTAAGGRLAAEAKTVQVLYDWGTRRPKTVTEELRRRIAAFEEGGGP